MVQSFLTISGNGRQLDLPVRIQSMPLRRTARQSHRRAKAPVNHTAKISIRYQTLGTLRSENIVDLLQYILHLVQTALYRLLDQRSHALNACTREYLPALRFNGQSHHNVSIGFVPYLSTSLHQLQKYRVDHSSPPGRLIDSKIMVELKILVIILCHDHALLVN